MNGNNTQKHCAGTWLMHRADQLRQCLIPRYASAAIELRVAFDRGAYLFGEECAAKKAFLEQ